MVNILKLYLQICGLVCVGIGTWLVLDRYAVDSLASASEKVQVTDDGLRELVCCCDKVSSDLLS